MNSYNETESNNHWLDGIESKQIEVLFIFLSFEANDISVGWFVKEIVMAIIIIVYLLSILNACILRLPLVKSSLENLDNQKQMFILDIWRVEFRTEKQRHSFVYSAIIFSHLYVFRLCICIWNHST